MSSIMDAGALHISNCNYTADALLGFVRSLLARDERLLGEVVLRSALMRLSGEDLHHVITRIDVLPKSHNVATSMIADYGRFLFVRETLSQQTLLERLAKLSELKFQITDHTVASTTGIGFSDRLEPSKTGPFRHAPFSTSTLGTHSCHTNPCFIQAQVLFVGVRCDPGILRVAQF